MIGSVYVFINLQCSLVQRLRRLVVVLRIVQESQIVETPCRIGMIGSMYLFIDAESPLEA